MRHFRSVIAGLSAGACAAALSACGGNSTRPALPTISGIESQLHPAVSPQRILAGLARPLRTSAAHERSWISSQAKSGSLLYVANTGAGAANIYAYPALAPVGRLVGFDEPYPMCVDAHADVYIPDFSTAHILEYAHGAISPLRTLDDRAGIPLSCAVDPITGNLAVANFRGPGSTQGNVLVYAKATGTPTKFTSPDILACFFVAYDNTGDLFLNGKASSAALLDELPKGQSAFKRIALNQAIEVPAGLAWDGKYLAFGDQQTNIIHQFKVAASKATEHGATTLNGVETVFQFFPTGGTTKHPQATAVVGADFNGNAVDQWPYPAGGMPVATISGLDTPAGVVISK